MEKQLQTRLTGNRLIAIILTIVILIILSLQESPSFLILFPILLLTLFISWFLYKEIERDQKENLKQGIRYMKEEEEAQQWLKTSFVPKTRTLAKKNMRNVIIASGCILLSFIFLWSFFVEGLSTAIINTFFALLFFCCFIIYALYIPSEFTTLFKRVPRRFKHHSKNDWVHGYLLLAPLALLGFFIYSLTTIGEGIIGSLYTMLIFFFSYTLLFICVFCVWFLYQEYQRETELQVKKTAKKILRGK